MYRFQFFIVLQVVLLCPVVKLRAQPTIPNTTTVGNVYYFFADATGTSGGSPVFTDTIMELNGYKWTNLFPDFPNLGFFGNNVLKDGTLESNPLIGMGTNFTLIGVDLVTVANVFQSRDAIILRESTAGFGSAGQDLNILMENSILTNAFTSGSISITGFGIVPQSTLGSVAPATGTVDLKRTFDFPGGTFHVISTGMANLGPLATLQDTEIQAPNGITLLGTSSIVGDGQIQGRIAAGMGSRIEASSGDLELGALVVDGYSSDGDLHTGANTVTINDANEAVLGSLTTLGDGTDKGRLVAGNATPDLGTDNAGLPDDFLLEDGKNVIGRGSIAGNFRNMGSVIGDGTTMSTRIEFEDGFTVTGIGYAENVLYSGNHSPGLSPAVVTGKNQAFAGTVELELGGTAPGGGSNGHDQIVDLGDVELIDGVDLSIKPWNGFEPTIGDEFEVLTWGDSLAGEFDQVMVDPFFTGMGIDFELIYGEDSLMLAAVAAGPAGDFNGDGNVDGADFLAWQRDPSVGALTDWQANHGFDAALSASSSPVPEPTTAMLTALAVLGLGCSCRSTR